MTPTLGREREVLDVFAATGGVRVPEPNITGIDTKSFTGWVADLAFAQPDVERYFLVKATRPWSGISVFSKDLCLAITEDAGTALEPGRTPWGAQFGEALAATGCGYFIERALESTVHVSNLGWMTPLHISIGPGLAAAPAGELLGLARELMVGPAAETPDATESPDLVEAVRQIREATKLPVQDVSAMLGIKRRQFYNWLDGTNEPPSDRVRRLFALREAVSRLSMAAHGDARRVRLALLAPIAGDCVFEAFAADDAERIPASVEAAERAIVEGTRLVRRVPPSARAKSAPGAAKEVRFERDSIGLYPESPLEKETLDFDDRS